uniref:CCHC-type domain-containing protein n=1 Tax=Ananas comosus var. bracteatus TaxID=296719 RepID=A0A6V7PLF6_ANACO|nr:unnamed protein product [Ananas comosus var. bracteatus]
MASSSLSSHKRSPFSVNIKDLVPIDLDSMSFLSWKHLIIPVLSMYHLKGHIDGSESAPPPTVTDSDNKEVPNPEYTKWVEEDMLILSWINTTLHKESIPLLYDVTSAKHAWDLLNKHFFDRSSARANYFRNQLNNLRKGTLSAEEYMQKIKFFSDSLSAIGQPMTQSELRSVIFKGLPPQFSTFIEIASEKDPTPSFQELWTMLLNHESIIEQVHSSIDAASSQPTAFFSSSSSKPSSTPTFYPNSPNQGGRSSRGHGRGRGRWQFAMSNFGRGYYSNPPTPPAYSTSPHSNCSLLGAPPSFSFSNPAYSTIQCQICDALGHMAKDCPHCCNQVYQPSNAFPSHIAALSLNEATNSAWYMDSGASAHMTNDQGCTDRESSTLQLQ